MSQRRGESNPDESLMEHTEVHIPRMSELGASCLSHRYHLLEE